MKGSTNALTSGGAVVSGEKINITLKTNQPSHADLTGVKFSVSYGEHVQEYEWNGSTMTVLVPAYATYTISFSEVEGYKRPDDVTFDAVGGNARSLELEFKTELVSVSVSADNGESMVGTEVTVNGVPYVYNGTAIVKKIPFGEVYSVSAPEREGYIAPSVQSYIASQASREIVVQYVYDPYIDLSRKDIHGNDVSQNTANCYVVKEAGKYMFPIAYGAAIKNGAVNTEAFTNNGGANSHDFVNYKGHVITSPYIETDTATQAASVQMSISDTENAVTDLEIVEGNGCRYVQFNVPGVPATGGNAVVSVKDASGVIMWSWHIWLWADDLTPVSITNATNVTYDILPVNLGSKWDEDAKAHIKNWFYQFGRPTPLLCPAAYNSNTNHASYGSLSYVIASSAADLHTAITNPTTFYKGNSQHWFSNNKHKIFNLWDASKKTAGNADSNVVKSVYDPSPIGFKMPNGNVFSYFSSNSVGSFNYGHRFRRYAGDSVGVFFPASGQRLGTDGVLYRTGVYGMIWTSSPYTDGYYAYYLHFNETEVHPQNLQNPAHAFSVRPVKDEDLQLPTHKLTINVSGDTAAPSGYVITGYQVTESVDETTGETTVTLGDVLFTQTTASATHDIPWGTKYRIVASDVDGFTTPAVQDYSANTTSRTVSLMYVQRAGTLNPANGVWIQDTDGYCHTVDEWTGEYTANGIAVVTSNCSFVIALKNAHTSYCEWGSYGTNVTGITTTTSESTAQGDYDGEAQTTTILNQLGNSSSASDAPAAYYCRAYTFPNGSTGYLGAAGEWQAALDNKAAVASALSKCGGTSMSDFYWTSTQYSSYYSWYMYWDYEYLYDYNKSNIIYVRAFAAI